MTRGALTTFSDRQRRRQVLRDHPGDVRRAPTRRSARSTSCGLATPAERDPVGGDLQRADHRRADPAGAARA
ncbi:MAG: hypothetical protein MZV49_18790 [Rhodopseudomonas palustris]|nr:hypothetical protein [Rhodopseudomonas palustris]